MISENARRILNKRLGRVARRVKNFRKAPRTRVVKNEAAEVEEKAEEKTEVADTTVTVENEAQFCGLALPSTFPTK